MKKILKAFNKLVFLFPKTESEVYNIETLGKAIEKEALNALATFVSIGDRYETGRIDRKDQNQFILGAIGTVEYFVRCGKGFTPKLSLLLGRGIPVGTNCLGRAMILGSMLRHEHYGQQTVYLGLTPDHAMVLVEIHGELYFCSDGSRLMLKKLHGTFVSHAGYRWYTRSEKDDFKFNYIVIQDFVPGIINAIAESFLFLQRAPWIDKTCKEDLGPLIFNHPKLRIRTRIRTFNWCYFQKKYFSELNEYKETYKKEHLLDFLFTEEWRHENRIQSRFMEATSVAYELALNRKYAIEKHKEFIRGYTSLLKTVKDKLLLFFEQDGVNLSLPKQLMVYLIALKKEVQKDEDLKTFALERFESLFSREQRA